MELTHDTMTIQMQRIGGMIMGNGYRLVYDNSGHTYVIPADRDVDWDTWLELDDEDEAAWNAPYWATRVDAGRLVFESWSEV